MLLHGLKEDPNHIYIMCALPSNDSSSSRPSTTTSTTSPFKSKVRSKIQYAKSYAQRFTLTNNDHTKIQYTFAIAIVVMLLIIHILSISDGNDITSTNQGVIGLRFSYNNNNQKDNNKLEIKTNQFSHSKINSPYEQIWINSPLPHWAKKTHAFRKIESTIPPSQRICYVHVGKAGGSSVGCSLGFSLHCNNHTQLPLQGRMPQRATRMFHADTYDCHDDSAYFLFIVRNPVERVKSAFLYDRPKSEKELKRTLPEYYERRKEYYLDCPSFGVMERMVQDGLAKGGGASDVCKRRAVTALRGERHFGCHMYFNYQFHLEGIPKEAEVLVIRNEHLVRDWNSAEHTVGGPKEIIPPELANTTIKVVNKSDKDARDKELSRESTRLVCRELCNEIVNYKKILRRALNLNYGEVERSVEELRETCGKYADYEEGDCRVPMPDIGEKLINTRGYEDLVMEGSYHINKDKLENTMHPKRMDNEEEAQALMDDDSYTLPYSV